MFLLRVLELNTQLHPIVLHTALGDVYSKGDKDYARAKQHYAIACEQQPSVTLWIKVGKAQEKLKLFVEAADAYRQAIALDSQDSLSHLRLGWVLNRQILI